MVFTTADATIINRGRGPEIAGTRITVYDVMDYLKHGWHRDRIAALFRLSSRDIQAAIDYIDQHRGAAPGSDSGFGIQTQSLFNRCHLPRHISVRFGETLPAFYQVRCAIRMAQSESPRQLSKCRGR